MKFQACTYTRTKADSRHFGIAKLNLSFGDCDVAWIVDAETGEKQKKIWEYWLLDQPLAFIDTEYH